MDNLGTPPSTGNCSYEAHFQYHLFPAVYTIVFILGLTGNVSALCIFMKKTKNASPSFIYIANLIVVDIIYICTLPFRIHYHIKKNNWIFGDITCRITGTFYFANIYLSVTFLSLICMDRYIAVVHPRKYIRMRGTNCSRVTSALVWMLAFAIMLPLIFSGSLNNVQANNTTACFENFDADAYSKKMAVYHIMAFLFGFLLPFTVIIIFYPLAAKKIAQLKSSVHKEKALTIIWVIMVISILCFVPYHITHLLYFLARLDFIQNCAFGNFLYKIRRVTMALVSLNCCLDPLIYFFATNKFKLNYGRKRGSLQKVYSIACRQTQN
ncbi:lysophosphatidic acid receptor 6 [Pristis pectinata]|uniref:lysophosphatidic acid receptor 6 n=1 Tax=Pristis pectinata TaxID=685728 RepID=UPI00223C93FA|nr:lysophosphatidic acid receptor 6 [Pristis pectinata]